MPINRSFYFIKHGETDWNLEGRLQGQTDIPLNKTGREQARNAISLVTRLPIDMIVTSNLSCAHETAKIINEILQLPLIVDPQIKEVNFGDVEGKTYKECNQHTEEMTKTNPKSIEITGYALAKNGEPYPKFNKRIITAFNKYLNENPNKNILFLSHAGVFRTLALSTITKYAESKNAYPYLFEKKEEKWNLIKI